VAATNNSMQQGPQQESCTWNSEQNKKEKGHQTTEGCSNFLWKKTLSLGLNTEFNKGSSVFQLLQTPVMLGLSTRKSIIIMKSCRFILHTSWQPLPPIILSRLIS
jgi:hypothetical protein